MKDWVYGYLVKAKEEGRLENKPCETLSELLNTNFSRASDEFGNLFDFVLQKLPKHVFEKLDSMKNVFYIFSDDRGGGEVKVFKVNKSIQKDDILRIVNFQHFLVDLDCKVSQGIIVHELAHIYLEHEDSGKDSPNEEAADNHAIEWGFEKEIEAYQKFNPQSLKNI